MKAKKAAAPHKQTSQPDSHNSRIPFRQSPRWIETEREAILDYLCGDVPDDEVRAAAFYELARESESFRYAAKKFKRGAEHEIAAPSCVSNVARERPADFDFQIIQGPGRAVWTCRQFPKSPWTELPQTEKDKFHTHFGRGTQLPFNTLDVELLSRMGVIKTLGMLADKTSDNRRHQRANELSEKAQSMPVVAADCDNRAPWIEHIICTLNYRDGKDALVNAFRTWLETNRAELLSQHYSKPLVKGSEHSFDKFHGTLKSLTAARLYKTLGFIEAKKWTVANHRLRDGKLLPYHRQKVRKNLNRHLKELKKSEDGSNKGGALFEESRQWEKALDDSLAALHSLSALG